MKRCQQSKEVATFAFLKCFFLNYLSKSCLWGGLGKTDFGENELGKIVFLLRTNVLIMAPNNVSRLRVVPKSVSCFRKVFHSSRKCFMVPTSVSWFRRVLHGSDKCFMAPERCFVAPEQCFDGPWTMAMAIT